MKQEVKVTFYIKRNETNNDGKSPVMAKLFAGKSTATFSVKMTVPADMWASGRAAGKSQPANEINKQLDEIRAAALSYYRELSAVRDCVTAQEVKNLLLGMASGQQTLLSYFRSHNENFDKRIGVNRKQGSEKGYWLALNHLTNFLKEKQRLSDIPFAALDRSFIDKFGISN